MKGQAGAQDSSSYELIPKERDTGFEWTNVEENYAGRVMQRISNSSDGAQVKIYRKYICGEEALRIPASMPYTLYRPMCRGRLNISSKYSLQQVRIGLCFLLRDQFVLASLGRNP